MRSLLATRPRHGFNPFNLSHDLLGMKAAAFEKAVYSCVQMAAD